MSNVTMHIYPTYGHWVVTDDVDVMFTEPGSGSSAGWLTRNSNPIRLPRDQVFTMLTHPSMRSRYVDIIHHADPYTES